MIRRGWLFAAFLLAPPLEAQGDGDLHLRRLVAVPVGALPPMQMLMLASRNHNYLVGRVQTGTRWQSADADHATIAGGIDLQWRGGSVLGITAGYQMVDCEDAAAPAICDSHALFGARARFNVVTGGPTLASLVGDNSATTALGAEIGLGYAPNAVSGRNACAMDFALPVTVSLFQRVRLLTFLTPGIAWDVRCPHAGSAATGASTFAGIGFGFQQLGSRGLDVSVGLQRIFRRGSGFQVGVNVTYVRLP